MIKNKIFVFFAFVLLSFSLGVSDVFADCSKCDVSDCESCGCVLNSAKNACIYSNYEKGTVSCGSGTVTDIPQMLPNVTSIFYRIIQIAIPIILVIMGSLDLFKGISAQKEEEMKKGQQMFIKRLVAAAIIFFVFAIVKALISFVADDNSASILECAECFISGNCDV